MDRTGADGVVTTVDDEVPLAVLGADGGLGWANDRAEVAAGARGHRWFSELAGDEGALVTCADGEVRRVRLEQLAGGSRLVLLEPVDGDRARRAAEVIRSEIHLVAAALHDTAIQRVAAALLLLDNEGLAAHSPARRELEQAVVAGRHLLDAIRPPLLDELGVHAALLDELGAGVRERGIDLVYDGPSGAGSVPEGGRALLWRAVSTTVRAATSDEGCSRVELALEVTADWAHGEVRDDGCGPRPVADGDGPTELGRAQAMLDAFGGRLRVESGRDGTLSSFSVPVWDGWRDLT